MTTANSNASSVQDSDYVSLAGAEVTINSLMEAGAHFGHQTERWNPKMLPYIFGVRNNTHIINLDMTIRMWERARKYVCDVVGRGGTVLFVGTKNQAREIVRKEAERSGAFHVTSRWLGGTLTNFQTIKNSIDRMRKMEELLVQAAQENSKIKLVKKEKLTMARDIEKLSANLGGIRHMKRAPDVLFVVDVIKESIAVAEARRLHIPVVALVDTNTEPTRIDFPVPCNDDATKTIKLLTCAMADAVIEGRSAYEARMQTEGDRKSGGDSRRDTNGHAESAIVEPEMAADGIA